MKKYSGFLVALLAIVLGYAYGRKQKALRLERERAAADQPASLPEQAPRPAVQPVLLPVPADLPTDQSRPDSLPKVIQ